MNTIPLFNAVRAEITMSRWPHRTAQVLMVWLLLAGTARAQDFRVATTLSSLPPNSRPEVVARTLTLFHAGMVYDRMEQLGEVIVFEPVHNRFVIMNGTHYTATELHFEELQQFLKVAHAEAVKYMGELKTKEPHHAQRVIEALRFQLEPRFEQQFDPATGRLSLTSEHLNYHVQTAPLDQPELAQQYLQYADWTARLNYILLPQTLYPEARLRLNQALRDSGRIPTRVELTVTHPEGATRLRAEHKFGWELQEFDKVWIQRWKSFRASDQVRWVDFHEYQRRLLSTVAK